MLAFIASRFVLDNASSTTHLRRTAPHRTPEPSPTRTGTYTDRRCKTCLDQRTRQRARLDPQSSMPPAYSPKESVRSAASQALESATDHQQTPIPKRSEPSHQEPEDSGL